MKSPRATTAPTSFGHEPGTPDPAREARHLETARRYLAAIEGGASEGEDGWPAGAFLHPEIVQQEFPNRLVPAGAVRDLAALREGAARGRAVLREQRYEVHSAHACDDTVILEVLWVGTLAMPVGNLAPGDEMRAHFAVFLEFRDGLIHRQRNYDCFDAF